MPDPVEGSGIPVNVPPDNEELKEPPGEWTAPEALVGDVYEMRVHSKPTAYVWLQRGTLWAWFYVGVHHMGLINIDDPVECPITEVCEKYMVIDGADVHDSLTGSMVPSHHQRQAMTNRGKKRTQEMTNHGTCQCVTLAISSQ